MEATDAHHPAHHTSDARALGHEHGHQHSRPNDDFMGKLADAYDSWPFYAEVTGAIGRAFLKEYAFSKEKTQVLDFACGTGLPSRELVPYAERIVGVDISQAMVDRYNRRAASQGIAPEKMGAIRADLKGVEGELGGQKFDVIVCSLAYHHFESVQDMTRSLAFFLKPGGALLVADFIKGEKQVVIPPGISDILQHQMKHAETHNQGYDEASMRSIFEGAGLGEFKFSPSVHIADGEAAVNVFIAKGIKPVEN